MTDFVDDSLVAGGESSSDSSLSEEAFLGDPSKVVTARGTEDGLVLRIDGRASWEEILSDLESFLGGRRKFFEGGEVSVEWLERLPTKEQSSELEVLLRDQYGIQIIVRRKKLPRSTAGGDENVSKQQKKNQGVTIPLFNQTERGQGVHSDVSPRNLVEEVEALANMTGPSSSMDSFAQESSSGGGSSSQRNYLNHMARMLGDEACYEDDANSRVVFGTLRSGQRIETPFSLVVVGDVNPGADLIAGGDIIVIGSLRGTAHASAYDDDSFEHVIIALRMQPMQLRIGSVISRGSNEVVKGAEIARIESRRIIVEPYNPRAMWGRKAR